MVSILSADATTAYSRTGYYVAPKLVDHRYIDRFLGEMNLVLQAQLRHSGLAFVAGPGMAAIYENLKRLHGHDQRVYLAVLLALNKLKSLYELFLCDEIARACRELGIVLPLHHTLPLFHVLSDQLRIMGGYHGFDAHQDWTGLQTSLNTIVVWLPFHDMDHDQFPLEVLPGSHLQGLARGTTIDNEYRFDESVVADKPFVAVTPRKGDVVFMSCFTIHRTALRETEKLRIAASWRYEDALEETFIERRYPFAQTRVVRHDPLLPDFPTAEQLQKVFR